MHTQTERQTDRKTDMHCYSPQTTYHDPKQVNESSSSGGGAEAYLYAKKKQQVWETPIVHLLSVILCTHVIPRQTMDSYRSLVTPPTHLRVAKVVALVLEWVLSSQHNI